MDDKFVKYSKLYVLIFLAFLAVPVCFGAVLGTFYGFSKLISSKPVDMLFELIVIAIPSAIICTACVIFARRTKKHPYSIVRAISYLFFIACFMACAACLVLDVLSFFKIRGHNITDYLSYSVPFMGGTIGGLFLIAIIQAFSTEKEKDWMERAEQRFPSEDINKV